MNLILVSMGDVTSVMSHAVALLHKGGSKVNLILVSMGDVTSVMSHAVALLHKGGSTSKLLFACNTYGYQKTLHWKSSIRLIGNSPLTQALFNSTDYM